MRQFNPGDSANLISSDPSRAVTLVESRTSSVDSPKGLAKPPPLDDPECDRIIPDRLVSFRSAIGAWELRRAISDDEYAKVYGRLIAIECALVPFSLADRDRVDLALNALLMGFRNQRRQGEDADTATVGVLRVVLRDYPAWAIEETWLRIARQESWLDPHWVPSDAEIAAVAKEVVTPYRARRGAIKALLAAKVALPEPPHPTLAEIEAKLGRPVSKMTAAKEVPDPPPSHDGKHAERVEADLAARRAHRLLALPLHSIPVEGAHG